jgi:multiple sugar transport system permease protein
VKPGLVAAAIFNPIFAWNEFLFNYFLSGFGSTMIPVLLATGAISFSQTYLLIGMTFGTVRREG